MPRFLSFFSAVAFVGLALLSLPASATPDFIPIVAFLEDDNGPVNGEVDVDVYLGQWDNGGTSLVSTTVMVVDGLLVIEVPHLSISAAEADPFLNLVIDGEALAGDIPVGKVFFADHADSATSAESAETVAWTNIAGRPAGLDDGDDNTTYSAGSGLTLSTTQFSITSGGVTSTHLANNAVNGAKIADGTISSADLGTNSVGSSEIAAGVVGSDEIATGAVGSSEIGANAVGNSEMNDDAVGSAEIIDESIRSHDIYDGTINTDDIANGTITSNDIASSTTWPGSLAANSVGSSQIAASAVRRTEISGTEISVYEEDAGCGGGITTSSTCQTLMCNWISGPGPQFYNCARSSCSLPTSQTCTGLNRVGYLLAPSIP